MLEVSIDPHAIRVGQCFAVAFQRTLRIPDDGRTYPLPPGLGVFPLYRIADYNDRVPREWAEQGGVMLPMYQREALWLGFNAAAWKPSAVKIAVGRVNAISGAPYDAILRAEPQDYIVCPDQIWLDGINAGHNAIRQFVAMPLGYGYTVEAAVTGTEQFGGIQLTVYEPKPGRFPEHPPEVDAHTGPVRRAQPASHMPARPDMGLGAGGVMRQKIYPDPYGLEVWDQENVGSITVHIVNSAQFFAITGVAPPPTPIDAYTYTAHGLPWFDLYDEAQGDVAPPDELSGAKTITARDAALGESPVDTPSVDIPETQITHIRKEE